MISEYDIKLKGSKEELDKVDIIYIIRNYIWKIEYIEDRIKEIDETKDKTDSLYWIQTSTIYRTILEELIDQLKKISWENKI